LDSKERFSKRVEYYAAYRPSYPVTLLTYLRDHLSLSQQSVIADVGSGTGILTEMFLKNGNIVFGVEPNDEMRKVAVERLSRYPKFRSVAGSAESTTLVSKSVDFITAGQSFHWFRPNETKQEFRRVLRINGWVVLVWNTRKTEGPFLKEYEELVTWISELRKNRVKHEDISDKAVGAFLGDYESTRLQTSQKLSLDGLIGRLMSASYCPLPGEELHSELLAKATQMFERYQRSGSVALEYWTEVYAGQLD